MAIVPSTAPAPGRQYRTILYIALILLAVSVVYLVYVRTHPVSAPAQPIAQRTPANAQVSVERSDVDTREVPPGFPKDIPLEENAVITANYTAVVNGSTQQATRSYESSRTLDDNFKMYRDYLGSHGWMVVSQVEQGGYKSLTGLKEGKTLQVLISENSNSKIISVDLSVTTPAPEKK